MNTQTLEFRAHKENTQQATIWCEFWFGGVSVACFFDHEDEIAVTVKGTR